MGKKSVKGKSLSALAAGLSGRQVQPEKRSSGGAAPRDPLVAALARNGDVARKVTHGLLSKSEPRAQGALFRPLENRSSGAETRAAGTPHRPMISASRPADNRESQAPRSADSRALQSRSGASASAQRPAPASRPTTSASAESRAAAMQGRAAASVARSAESRAPLAQSRPASGSTHGRDSGARSPLQQTSSARPSEARAPVMLRGPMPSQSPARVALPSSRAVPPSRPGPSAAVSSSLAGTSRNASQVASLVKAVEKSHAAPTKAMGRLSAQQLAESRRQYPRVELQVQAKLALADDPTHYFEANLPTANVSVGGMFLASTFFLKVGTRLEVRLSLPPHGREVHVKGHVVRQEPGGFALSFTEYLEGSEVVLATHFLSPVLRDFIEHYAKGNGFKPTPEYLANTADVLAAWELRRAQLGGDVWVVPGDKR